MSAGSRNTQGRGQTAQVGALDAFLYASVNQMRAAGELPDAPLDEPSSQDRAKPYYGTCKTPTGPCILAAFHEGDHFPPHKRPVLDERDELLAILRLALPLLKDWPFTRGAALCRPLVSRIEGILARTR